MSEILSSSKTPMMKDLMTDLMNHLNESITETEGSWIPALENAVPLLERQSRNTPTSHISGHACLLQTEIRSS